MKFFDWNEAKNVQIKIERGVGFEDIQSALEEGKLLDNISHPNRKLYPEQRVFVVEINGYAFMVPFVEDEEKIFLKTLYPSRKFTKTYLTKGGK